MTIATTGTQRAAKRLAEYVTQQRERLKDAVFPNALWRQVIRAMQRRNDKAARKAEIAMRLMAKRQKAVVA